VTVEAKKNNIMRSMTLKFIRKVLAIKSRYHMETRVVLSFSTAHALILSIYSIEVVIIEVLVRLYSSSAAIGLEQQTDYERFIADLLA